MTRNNKSTFILFSFSILLSLALYSCRGLFYNTQTCYQSNLTLKPYDAIIVPGIQFENGNWNYIMKGRVLWSVYLYNQGITKNIIYSGSAVYSPYTEAKIMALYAEKLGVHPEHIFVEPRAEHSTENIFYSCLIAKKNGFTRVAVATDRFQSRTLADFLPKIKRKTGIDIKSLPLQDDLMRTVSHHDPVINYELAKVDSFVSIVERESKLKRFFGTMGFHIDYDEAKDVFQPEAEKPRSTK